MPNLLDLMRDEIERAALRTEAFRSLTFVKVTGATRDPSARTAGIRATTVSFSCVGIVVGYRNADINGETIQRGDRQIMILAQSLNLPTGTLPPEAGDQVVGDDARTYQVLDVGRDPSGALYVLHGRG